MLKNLRAHANGVGSTAFTRAVRFLGHTRALKQMRYEYVGIRRGPARDRTKNASKRKNPAAVALGRKGGLTGVRARAEALTPEKRKAIAKNAALARWSSQT